MDNTINSSLLKGANRQRLNYKEALELMKSGSLQDSFRLMEAALKNRRARFGKNATYIYNLTVNPSNICDSGCKFCHFSRKEGDKDAYLLNEDEIMKKIEDFRPNEIHIVGGLNKHWKFQRYAGLLENISSRWPKIYIKCFSAVEIDYFARTENKTYSYILERFREAGLNHLPGGGAEIFSQRMRKQYFPNKISSDKWIEIHKAAHRLKINTNATMLYGMGETGEEIINHLFTLRKAQDESGGFDSFVPLAYQVSKKNTAERAPSVLDNLKIIAIARLLLDNFNHIKAYWPMIGLETASAALSWGADDLDGTLGDEQVAHAGAAKSPKSLSKDLMVNAISSGGFVPVERDGRFKKIHG